MFVQCYGAEDDRTFGIPGEVTSQPFFFQSEQDILKKCQTGFS